MVHKASRPRHEGQSGPECGKGIVGEGVGAEEEVIKCEKENSRMVAAVFILMSRNLLFIQASRQPMNSK